MSRPDTRLSTRRSFLRTGGAAAGVALDLPGAYRWFYIAAEADYPAAAESRDEIAAVLTQIQLDAARESAQTWIRAHR